MLDDPDYQADESVETVNRSAIATGWWAGKAVGEWELGAGNNPI